jgi:hypothetical protein
VFRYNGAGWSSEQVLTASDEAVYDHGFGDSVAISGDVAVVSARLDGDNGSHSGAAYLYRFDGANWIEEAKFLPEDGTAYDEFGSSVSVSGDVAVVGAYQDDDSGGDSGSAYVFSSLAGDPACSNGADDDGDGLVDLDDPGCALALETSEHSSALVCDDGLDNDGDGLIDYPEDPGCRDPEASSEKPECQDGVDNDGDGVVDMADPSCADPDDSSEAEECRDGLDNDGDGQVDYPDDAGCLSRGDLSEASDCRDGIDNDGDGLVDLADPGCLDASDPVEAGVTIKVNAAAPDTPATDGTCSLREAIANANENAATWPDCPCWLVL